MKKIILFIAYLLSTLDMALADSINTFDPYNEIIYEINPPWINWYNFDRRWNILYIAKEILARAISVLPMLILVLLLLACIKIIFEWDGKAWLKRIKYILIWVALMILSVYLVNILSTIFFWYPVLNINFSRR